MGSKLGTADRIEGKRREPGRMKRTKGSQKNQAALVLLKSSPSHVAPRFQALLRLPLKSISCLRIEKYSDFIGCSKF